MSNVITKLKKIRINNESDANIANFVIDNIKIMDNIDIRDLAKKINHSTSSVTRFIKRLGYSSFNEFKYEVKNYINSVLVDSKYQNNENKELSLIIKSEISYINEILEKNNIIWTKDKKIDQVIEKINLSKQIFIFAMGGTYSVAYDFCLKLQRLGFNVNVSNDSVIQETLLSANSTKKDCLFIIFSLSGETKQLVYVAEKINEKKMFLISFTGLEENKIKKLSNLNLSIFNNDNHFKSLIKGNRISFIFLIDILIQLLINLNSEKNYKSVLITTK
ncbi:MurR/RpiR family transcriptional regulator [Spiroplasma cantharicola]|uniref:RpiR family transcriptional regulator, murPQ operon repressor n=1 Tax=Spiroplasma cantharicola TaxID=362837 RepID=A0A0M4KCM7_9MOLU|nr:MurR/RpiR family transcriptional regulator [Spiroplasma cantharicola]ALD66502.1 RpiR family transcriptional regulator, murPQ operon repressor [Spiroplasma cantharicola]